MSTIQPFFHLRTASELSKLAKKLAQPHSLNISHGHCMEVVAASFGFSKAASLQAELKKGALIVQVDFEAARNKLHSLQHPGEVTNLAFWVVALLSEVIVPLEQTETGTSLLKTFSGRPVITQHRDSQELQEKGRLHTQILNIIEAEETTGITDSTPYYIRFDENRPQSNAIAIPFLAFLDKVSPERRGTYGLKLYDVLQKEEKLCLERKIPIELSGNQPGRYEAYRGGADFDISLDIRRRKIEKKICSLLKGNEPRKLNELFAHYVLCCEEALRFRSVALANNAFVEASIRSRYSVPKPMFSNLDDLLKEESLLEKMLRQNEERREQDRQRFLSPYKTAAA